MEKLLGALAGFVIAIVILGIVIYIAQAIFLNKFNRLVNGKGTAMAWIPIFNIYLLGKLTVNKLVGWILVGCIFLTGTHTTTINGIETSRTILPEGISSVVTTVYGLAVLGLFIYAIIKYNKIKKSGITNEKQTVAPQPQNVAQQPTQTVAPQPQNVAQQPTQTVAQQLQNVAQQPTQTVAQQPQNVAQQPTQTVAQQPQNVAQQPTQTVAQQPQNVAQQPTQTVAPQPQNVAQQPTQTVAQQPQNVVQQPTQQPTNISQEQQNPINNNPFNNGAM